MSQFLQAFGSFYEVIWVFIVYGFLGWCCEVGYATFELRKFVNRGFLNGPICPIYGFGIVFVVSILTPIKNNLLILFLGSLALTTLLELIVGWGLETLFHNQWWDYSMYRLNFKGYICLRFSLIWGLACTCVMDLVHPFIMQGIRALPRIPGNILISIMVIVFITDIIVTVSAIFKLNERLRVLNEIQIQLDRVSNEIGGNIHGGVSEALEVSDKVIANISDITDGLGETKQKLLNEKEELTKKYQEVLSEKVFGQNRLLKAFPEMKNKTYSVALDALKIAKGVLPDKIRLKK